MMGKVRAVLFVLFLLSYIVSDASELLDPTRPPDNFNGQKSISPAMFLLNGIILGPDRKIAVINGMNKQVGDQILGEYVSGIYENSVQLKGPSGSITLYLLGSPIKSSPNCTDNGKSICRDALK